MYSTCFQLLPWPLRLIFQTGWILYLGFHLHLSNSMDKQPDPSWTHEGTAHGFLKKQELVGEDDRQMPPAGCPTDQACYSQPQQLSSVQAAESADVPGFQQHQLPSELSAAKRDCTGRVFIMLWVNIDISGVSKSSFQDKVSTCSAKARAQGKKKKKHTTYLANAMFSHPNWPWTLPLVLPLVLFKFTPDTIQQFARSDKRQNQGTSLEDEAWHWDAGGSATRRPLQTDTAGPKDIKTEHNSLVFALAEHWHKNTWAYSSHPGF